MNSSLHNTYTENTTMEHSAPLKDYQIEKSGNRDFFLQQVRGICIIAVVLIHCQSGPIFGNFDWQFILRDFINFPVAIFFFLSGYFIKQTQKEEKITLFDGKRIKRILIPYIFWTLFYLACSFAVTFLKNESFDFLKIPKAFLLGNATPPLYFLNVLLQLTIITPLLLKIVRFRKFRILPLLTTPLYLLFIYSYQFYNLEELPFCIYATPCFAWFSFYYGGILIKATNSSFFKKFQISSTVFFCGVALLASLLESLYILKVGGGGLQSFSMSQIKFGTMIFTAFLIILIFKLRELPTKRNFLLEKLGDYSFGIYAWHIFWLMIITFLLKKLPIIEEVVPLYQFIQCVSTVLITFVAVKIVEKILGEKTTKLLGFK